MTNHIPVNFHCHSIFSDGDLTPEALAANLSASGVRYAALTDHDTLEGLPRFQEALKKYGIAYLSGVELACQMNGREIHLLGYGFDTENPDLAATLLSMRQVHELEVHSIAGSIRKVGVNHSNLSYVSAISSAPDGKLAISEAISLIHRAGGCVFLAHPLFYETDPERLEALIAELKNLGIDGIEAIFTEYTASQRESLQNIAAKHDLLISAGSDFHVNSTRVKNEFSIDLRREDWEKFRKRLFTAHESIADNQISLNSLPKLEKNGNIPSERLHQFKVRPYILRILLPTLLVISLFLAAIWGIILPSFEQTLLVRKHELIHELTNSAWSILSSYYRDEQNGRFTREEAQALAISRLEDLRYGPEGKDYFWIQDMQPRMIMHPYRTDLNGQDLSAFTDPRGVPIFVEFAELVRAKNEGYIDYVWQWNDDPQRIEPKESFVKGFEPWGWIIGTGIYIDDVKNEIARIERNLVNTSLAISGAVILLLMFVLQQSLRIERERQEVVDELGESTERYHSLVEAASEGTLLVIDKRCRYANPTFLNLTGYSANQLELLELSDVLPEESDNLLIWERFDLMEVGQIVEDQVFEGGLKHADGRIMDCILALNPIVFAGQSGYILLARIVQRSLDQVENAISQSAQSVPVGIFRARAVRRAPFIELNLAARSLIKNLFVQNPDLADLFSNADEFEDFLKNLKHERIVENHLIHLESSNAADHCLSLSAKLIHDDKSSAEYIDGTLIEVTHDKRLQKEQETLIEKLQTSLLFLHEPISQLGRNLLICDLNSSTTQISRQMTDKHVTAALIASDKDVIIGIVTDHDLRKRVLSQNFPASTPAHAILSAPLIKIKEEASVYEALMLMEENGVSHLAVEDQSGQIVSVVDNRSLIQFKSYAPIVLTREISRAESIEEVVRCTKRVLPMAKSLLDNSAKPNTVTNLLSATYDTATERLIRLAVDALGPAPVEFAFIAMGSQGRQETTLATDQDNGVIFAEPRKPDSGAVSDYFLKMGKLVSEGLNQAGYTYCKGNVMASNPRWCRSLPEWIAGFQDWVFKSDPQEIIDLSIFFDFRTIHGNAELTNVLRQNIHTTLMSENAIFYHLAQDALMFKPPFRLPGSLTLSGESGEINLKDAMMPIVCFARLYALRHQIVQTHTLERIETLRERNIILPSSRDDIVESYDLLMKLRLQSQIAAAQAGLPVTNIIHPGKLGNVQREILKQAFTQVSAIQKKISYDFLGGQ
jgi:PAS domain S-box-containing protein